MFTFLKKTSRNTILTLLVVALATPAALAFLPEKAEAQTSFPAPQCLIQYGITQAKALAESLFASGTSVPIANVGAQTSESSTAATSEADFITNCIEHDVALYIGRTLLAQMTNEIVQWINGGFHGDPLFVTNPGKFFADLGDQVVGSMIQGSDLAFLCSPFKVQIQLALVLNYSKKYSAGYANRSQCTLSAVVSNINNFYKNFNDGGWAGWFALTQNPHNNIYGEYLEASSELGVRINGKQVLKSQELSWGKGFLSFEECTDNNGNQTVSFSGDTPDGVQTTELGSNGQSSFDENSTITDCEIKTPGSTIAGVLDKQLGVPADQLGLADDLDKIINALADQVFQQFINGAGGLLGAKNDDAGHGRASDWVNQTRTRAGQAGARGQTNINLVNTPPVLNSNGEPTAAPGQNIAIGKIATASSFTSDGAPSKLVDGNTAGSITAYTEGAPKYDGAQTNPNTVPIGYFQIDLGATYKLGKVVIYQRTNKGPNSKQLNFHVEVLDKDQIVVSRSETLVQDFQNVIQVPIPAIKGRYVKIVGDENGALEFAEAQIYVYAPPTIVLKGTSPTTISVGDGFIDAGASAKDNKETDISATIVTTGAVDTGTAGAYTLTYVATDANNVSATTTRQVIVQE